MNATSIEWVKNPDGSQGYTWNPITGCLNHDNELCKGGGFPCYAYKLANGRLKSRYLANTNIAPLLEKPFTSIRTEQRINALSDPFYPRFWEERVLDLTTQRIRKHFIMPRGVFVCDMGELFGDWIPPIWQERVFDAIRRHAHWRFYLLTKQPQNLIKWSPFPDNCWVGVTATDARMAFEAEDSLARISARVKFISFEPLLGRIENPTGLLACLTRHIDWVIIGAQTKPYKPPKMKWIDEIVAACDEAKVPVFLKNNLMPLVEAVFGRENYLSPILTPDGDLRQEIPKVRG